MADFFSVAQEHSEASSPIWLLNSPVITTDGLFRCKTISLFDARDLVRLHGFESAIGHGKTASMISELLEIDCPMRRREFVHLPGQQALVFRLGRRLEEGRILHRHDEFEHVGYSFMLIIREA